jgi:hypothetical protein
MISLSTHIGLVAHLDAATAVSALPAGHSADEVCQAAVQAGMSLLDAAHLTAVYAAR